MIKLVCFLRRKPGMDLDEFNAHWLNHHGPLIARTPELARHIVRYEQNHRLPSDRQRDAADAPGFDGATIQWLHTQEAFFDFVREPKYGELIAPDEASFLDRSSLLVFFTHEEQVQISGERETAPVKLLALLRRRPGSEPDDFHAHWRGAHAALFKETPEIARHIVAYHQNRGLTTEESPMPLDWDGLAEQWFASSDEFEAMIREPRYLEQVPGDEELFLDRSAITWFLSQPPHVIIG